LHYEEKGLGRGSSGVNALLERGPYGGCASRDAYAQNGKRILFCSASTLLLPAKSLATGPGNFRSASPRDDSLRQPASLLRAAWAGKCPGAASDE